MLPQEVPLDWGIQRRHAEEPATHRAVEEEPIQVNMLNTKIDMKLSIRRISWQNSKITFKTSHLAPMAELPAMAGLGE